jgi:cytochrome P450
MRSLINTTINDRKAVKDTQLGDYFIPKGRLIAASSWVNGNDPELATNPEDVSASIEHIYQLFPKF